MPNSTLLPLLQKASQAAWRLSVTVDAVVPRRRGKRPDWTSAAEPPAEGVVTADIGFPRLTNSLCPMCFVERREAALKGDVESFRRNPGVIPASIVEEAGQVLMRKICSVHGPFEDLLATNADFHHRMESLYHGPDFPRDGVGDFGVSCSEYGRGSFLVVDLTNRCNMKCTPCFMNANSVGYVHELSMADIRAALDRALSVKPHREVNILFSGGEPTLSPHFLEAVRYARSVGFERLHVATNGIRFAQDLAFAEEARAAGLHSVFLQFDGVTEEGNAHRGTANLFEVKCRALARIAQAGLRTTLQVAVTGGVNDGQVGPILNFAARHSDKIVGVLFQPLMFAGRDERVDDDRRYEQRYTLSQLAEDLQAQTSVDWRPMRDWFPLSVFHKFANLVDALSGPNAVMGSVAANHHPGAAIMSPLVVNAETREWVPLAAFFDVERFLNDIASITAAGRTRGITMARVRLAIVRNFRRDAAPSGLGYRDLMSLFEQCIARVNTSVLTNWREREIGGKWQLLLVKGLALGDRFNFDFIANKTNTVQVATQEGEISFCAYNGGGWRQLVEAMNSTTDLREWHRQHGRHPIFANGQLVHLEGTSVPVARAGRIE